MSHIPLLTLSTNSSKKIFNLMKNSPPFISFHSRKRKKMKEPHVLFIIIIRSSSKTMKIILHVSEINDYDYQELLIISTPFIHQVQLLLDFRLFLKREIFIPFFCKFFPFSKFLLQVLIERERKISLKLIIPKRTIKCSTVSLSVAFI